MTSETLTRAERPTSNEAYFMELADGLFVGMMDDMEQAILQVPLRRGWLTRTYEGASGFLSLAKYRITEAGRAALATAEGGQDG